MSLAGSAYHSVLCCVFTLSHVFHYTCSIHYTNQDQYLRCVDCLLFIKRSHTHTHSHSTAHLSHCLQNIIKYNFKIMTLYCYLEIYPWRELDILRYFRAKLVLDCRVYQYHPIIDIRSPVAQSLAFHYNLNSLITVQYCTVNRSAKSCPKQVIRSHKLGITKGSQSPITNHQEG